jgi:hypothetical protein
MRSQPLAVPFHICIDITVLPWFSFVVRPMSAMKRIFSSPNLLEITQLKDTLESAGIGCFIRNEISSGLAPEIPMTESTPELWIQEDQNLVEAMQIKSDWQTIPKVMGNNWVCPACGETSEPQFTSCWKCGAARKDDHAA